MKRTDIQIINMQLGAISQKIDPHLNTNVFKCTGNVVSSRIVRTNIFSLGKI